MNIELKTAFGEYMGRYFAQLSPNTKALNEYVTRPLNKSIGITDSRMVDQIEEMLGSWRSKDNSGAPGSSAYLPVIFVAFAKDYSPVLGDYGRQIADPEYIMIPSDPKERVFMMRQAQGERRVQVAICAADEPTARSLAVQFTLFIASVRNRTFYAKYNFAGFDHLWPVQLETNDYSAVNVTVNQKNLTVLAIDMSIKESIPFFMAPKVGEANDGKGTNYTDDPSGYPNVLTVTTYDKVTKVSSVQHDGEDKPTWGTGDPA